MARRLRLVLFNLIDAFLINAAVVFALLLRFDGRIPPEFMQRYIEFSYLITVPALLSLNLFKVYRTLWRYAGISTALSISNALTLAFLATYALNLIIRPQPLPRSVLILAWILSVALILGMRLAWRLATQRGVRRTTGSRRILIVGAGDSGAMVARELSRSLAYAGHPIGFVDDDPGKLHARVETLEVLGTTFDLPRILKEKRVNEVIIAAPSAPTHLVRQVVRVCLDASVRCRTVPALADYIEGKGALDQVREVRIEDLLGREPIELDLPGIRQRVAERTVLVTGAGGSIGSELCRQIARFSPGKLVILDHNENGLCYLGLELRSGFPSLDLLSVVGDIRDEAGMRRLFTEQRPDFVFHAAAHKHVNLLENCPREAILNNVMGTRNVARACDAAGVKTLTLISTDKAVNPSSVMGASKRLCEMILQTMSRTTQTTLVAVRFGNVIGSAGSVLPIFRRQLARGGPLTVTHPGARRFFMTIPEASQLVIQASLLGQSGDVFILDMGEQVRILDVAKQLIRLSGLEPERDVRIDFIGLRPGEKLEEELLTYTERTRVTQHRKILKCELDELDPVVLNQAVDRLIELSSDAPSESIKAALQRLVPEYREMPPAPLPDTFPVADRVSVPEYFPRIDDLRGKRSLDVVMAGVGLLVLAAPVAFAWALVHLSGPGRIMFRAEQRIGADRRRSDRRDGSVQVGINRRSNERRKRPLPGRPFLAYCIRLEPSPMRAPFQQKLADWIEGIGLDRLPLLWNVLRGDMSLVGPSARLVDGQVCRWDSISVWCFARRPGLTGPAQLLGGGREESMLYDCYYGRHASMWLDLDALWRSLPRLLGSSHASSERPTEPSVIPAQSMGEGRRSP